MGEYDGDYELAVADLRILAAAVAQLRDEAGWIPTSEGHPLTQDDMLVVLQVDVIPEPLVDIGVYENGGWAYRGGEPIEDDNTTVTHWRPLPAPPEVQP
jgi:hypothetical protein